MFSRGKVQFSIFSTHATQHMLKACHFALYSVLSTWSKSSLSLIWILTKASRSRWPKHSPQLEQTLDKLFPDYWTLTFLFRVVNLENLPMVNVFSAPLSWKFPPVSCWFYNTGTSLSRIWYLSSIPLKYNHPERQGPCLSVAVTDQEPNFHGHQRANTNGLITLANLPFNSLNHFSTSPPQCLKNLLPFCFSAVDVKISLVLQQY